MARRPSALPPSLPWPVFTRAEAMRAGLSPDRLRRKDLENLRRGLFARRGERFGEIDLAAALCRQNTGVVIVGLSAARLLGIPMPRPLELWDRSTPVEAATSGARRRSDALVVWHDLRLGDSDLEKISHHDPRNGHSSLLRVTTRARTWRDLATHLEPGELVAAGDHLLRIPRPGLEGRWGPWCEVEELLAVATGRHARRLREAIGRMRVGADSPKETELRLALLAAGLPEPAINVPLVGDDGISRHSPDFQWHDFRVCAEYEGIGHSDPKQVQRDIRRARAAKAAGFTELRLAARDLADGCAAAVEIVRSELVAHGWRPDA